MLSLDVISHCVGFEWDAGNIDKNFISHGVEDRECEEVMTNFPLYIDDDILHSMAEKRYHGYGITDNFRVIFTAFTIRKDLIRIISARPMNTKEKHFYEQEIKRNTDLS